MLTSKKEIIDWLKINSILNYTINEDLSVDVNGDVDLNGYRKSISIFDLPVNFNVVNGNFNISYNDIMDFKGCPKFVGQDFVIMNTNIKSFKGCPKEVNGNFNCVGSMIKNFNDFDCVIGKNLIYSFNFTDKFYNSIDIESHIETFFNKDRLLFKINGDSLKKIMFKDKLVSNLNTKENVIKSKMKI